MKYNKYHNFFAFFNILSHALGGKKFTLNFCNFSHLCALIVKVSPHPGLQVGQVLGAAWAVA